MFRYSGAILRNLISLYKHTNHVTETALLYNVLTSLPKCYKKCLRRHSRQSDGMVSSSASTKFTFPGVTLTNVSPC